MKSLVLGSLLLLISTMSFAQSRSGQSGADKTAANLFIPPTALCMIQAWHEYSECLDLALDGLWELESYCHDDYMQARIDCTTF